MAAFDWLATPLGQPDAWPSALKTAVGLMLRTRQPASVVWGPRMAFLYNDAHAAICGSRHPAALGRPVSEVWADIWEQLRPINEACYQGVAQVHENVAFQLTGRDQASYFSFSYTPLVDDDGVTCGFYCTATETTAAMQFAMEQADALSLLQARDEQLRLTQQTMEVALEASRSGTFRWDIGTDRLWWDAALDRLFGLSPGQAVHTLDQFLALVHQDDRSEVIERCLRCRDLGDDFEMEFRVIHRDGSIHWLYDRGRTILDAAGRPSMMTGACVDITDRKRAEAALKSSEAFHRRMLASLPAMTFTAREDGNCDYLSDQWGMYTRVPLQRYLNTAWGDALHPQDRPGAAVAWTRAVQSGEPYTAEYRVRRHDGAYEWFKAHAVRIELEPGGPSKWVGAVLKIEDLKAVQASLQEREREVREITDNSPDVIARFDRRYRHIFVNAAAERLTGFPVTLFQGRTSRELGFALATCELLERAIDKVFADRKPITIQFEFERGGQVRHLSSRLVPELDDAARVDSVLCVTRDVTEAALAQEALRRADRLKDDFLATLAHELRNPLAPLRTGVEVLQRSGANVGNQRVLQIMQRQLNHVVRLVDELLDVARISQGKIVLQREVLPVSVVIGVGAERSQPSAPAATELLDGPRRRVLVVDDNVDAADTLAMLLKTQGHVVTVATSAQEGLRLAAEHRPEIAILDLGMPLMDGFELAHHLRQLFPRASDCKLVALTGWGAEEDRARSRAAGFDLHLTKPLDTRHLQQVLATEVT